MEGSSRTLDRRVRRGLILLAQLVVVGLFWALGRWDYLAFHAVVEIFSAFVFIGIFVVAWNTRKISQNSYLEILATGLLFVGLTSLLHMVTYKGMGILPGISAHAGVTTQLWIVSRVIAGAAFVVAGVRLYRPIPRNLVMASFAAVWIVSIFTIFVARVFPAMYVDGVGLTQLKIALEYVVMAMLAVGGTLLWRDRSAFDPIAVMHLLWAIILMVLAELAFTLYTDVYGVLNTIGHVFVLISSVLIYQALIDTTLTRPYASLFRELHRREQEEARIADVLQSALVCSPQRVGPVESGCAYRSATSGALVGGDFFELMAPGPGLVAFMLGDVCGKGIEAAATTAMVRTTMRSYAFENPTPSNVLRLSNEAMLRQLPSDRFVTVVYGTIDLVTGRMLIASAGHPDPLYRSVEAPTRVLELPRHPPLGVVKDEGFTSLAVDLAPGDLLVMMTDGVIDAGWKKDGFGVDRAVDAVSAANGNVPGVVADALLAAAVAHAGGTLSDDISIMALLYATDEA